MFTRAPNHFTRTATTLTLCFIVSALAVSDETKKLTLSKALAQVKLFAGLTDGERDLLNDAATLRRGKAGERVIQQGETSGRMLVILEGEAEVRINGKHIVTLSNQPLVGEIEFLLKRPATGDVTLLKDTDLVELNNAALTNIMEKHPRLGYVLMREIAVIEARRLRETSLRK